MINSKRRLEYEVKEEEKKCRENPNYIITEERMKEITISITNSIKCLKIKMIIFIIVDFLILFFLFYCGLLTSLS